MKVHVGCCGFQMSMKKYFQEYETVELQNTFYKLPSIETAKKWKELAGENFVFSVKAFQGITHPIGSPTWKRSGLKAEELQKLKDKVGFLRPTKEVFDFWNKNLEVCKALNARLCLIQLPQSFDDSKENLLNARKFFSKIKREGLEIAVELRGWSEKNIKALCKRFNLIHCTDPFVSMPTYFGKNKIAYFRLHGSYENNRINYKHKYSKKELKQLKEKLYSLDAKEAFVFFNNVFAKEDSKTFKQMLD